MDEASKAATCGDLGGRNADGSPCQRKAKGSLCMSHGGPEPKREGRPLKEINSEQVFQLARIDCSYEEMAAVLGCCPDTLMNRFSEVIKKGRDSGTASLKKQQFKLAMDGNPTMLIWLGKNKLGQTDKAAHEHSGPRGTPLPSVIEIFVVDSDGGSKPKRADD